MSNLYLLGIIVLLILLVSTYFVVTFLYPKPTLGMVTVSGKVVASGGGMSIKSITFTNATNFQFNSVNVTNGTYSVILPNFKTYNVSAYFASNYSWQSGRFDNFSQFSVNVMDNSGGSSQIQNFIVPTPSSNIDLHGAVELNSSATLSQVNFTMEFNTRKNYTSKIIPGNLYDVVLPNGGLTYKIQISYFTMQGLTKILHSCMPPTSPYVLAVGNNQSSVVLNLSGC